MPHDPGSTSYGIPDTYHSYSSGKGRGGPASHEHKRTPSQIEAHVRFVAIWASLGITVLDGFVHDYDCPRCGSFSSAKLSITAAGHYDCRECGYHGRGPSALLRDLPFIRSRVTRYDLLSSFSSITVDAGVGLAEWVDGKMVMVDSEGRPDPHLIPMRCPTPFRVLMVHRDHREAKWLEARCGRMSCPHERYLRHREIRSHLEDCLVTSLEAGHLYYWQGSEQDWVRASNALRDGANKMGRPYGGISIAGSDGVRRAFVAVEKWTHGEVLTCDAQGLCDRVAEVLWDSPVMDEGKCKTIRAIGCWTLPALRDPESCSEWEMADTRSTEDALVADAEEHDLAHKRGRLYTSIKFHDDEQYKLWLIRNGVTLRSWEKAALRNGMDRLVNIVLAKRGQPPIPPRVLVNY